MPHQLDDIRIYNKMDSVESLIESGAGRGIRTLDLRITKPPLFQLSYTSIFDDLKGVKPPQTMRLKFNFQLRCL